MKKIIIMLLVIVLAVLAGFAIWHPGTPTATPSDDSVASTTIKYSDTISIAWHNPAQTSLMQGADINLTKYNLSGTITESFPTAETENISAFTTPFQKYYDDKLKSEGWKLEPLLSAGGAGSAIWAYSKGNRYFLLSFKSTFLNTPANAPVQCPCTIVFKTFEGTKPAEVSGVSGTVTLGPTCPVMRNPPDPSCADKPYKTMIQVIESGTTRNSPFATGQSGADGKYEIMLPPGQYMVQPVGAGMLPRCESKDVTIVANTITELDLSCDSGIR